MTLPRLTIPRIKKCDLLASHALLTSRCIVELCLLWSADQFFVGPDKFVGFGHACTSSNGTSPLVSHLLLSPSATLYSHGIQRQTNGKSPASEIAGNLTRPHQMLNSGDGSSDGWGPWCPGRDWSRLDAREMFLFVRCLMASSGDNRTRFSLAWVVFRWPLFSRSRCLPTSRSIFGVQERMNMIHDSDPVLILLFQEDLRLEEYAAAVLDRVVADCRLTSAGTVQPVRQKS